MTIVRITLHDALAQKAPKARLLAAEPLAPMTPDDISAGIEAYRTSPRELQGMEIVTAVVAVERIAAAAWNNARAGRAVERQQVAIRPAELWMHGRLDVLVGVSVFVACVHCGYPADVHRAGPGARLVARRQAHRRVEGILAPTRSYAGVRPGRPAA
jgi:hypothetical protein